MKSPINIDSYQKEIDHHPFVTEDYFDEVDWKIVKESGLKFVPQSNITINGGNLQSESNYWRLEQ